MASDPRSGPGRQRPVRVGRRPRLAALALLVLFLLILIRSLEGTKRTPHHPLARPGSGQTFTSTTSPRRPRGK
jgi:hypothetical protein